MDERWNNLEWKYYKSYINFIIPDYTKLIIILNKIDWLRLFRTETADTISYHVM